MAIDIYRDNYLVTVTVNHLYTNGDVLTGSNGGVAIVTDYVTNGLTFYCVMISGTPFVNGETVTSQDGVTRIVNTCAAATLPPCVLVTGTIAGMAVYRQIYNASVANGWAIHSLSNIYTLQLVATIIIGRADQTAITAVITTNERVTINTGTPSGIICQGNATYPTYYTSGSGVHGEYCYSGTNLGLLGSAFFQRYAIVSILGSDFAGDGNWDLMFNGVVHYYWGTVFNLNSIIFAYGTQYYYDVIIVTNANGLACTTGGQTCVNLISRDNGVGFFCLGNNTITLSGVSFLANSYNFGAFLCTFTLNLVDSYVDVQTFICYYAVVDVYYKYTVNQAVITPAGVAVQNVRLRWWGANQDWKSATPIVDVLSSTGGLTTTQQITTDRYRATDATLVHTAYTPAYVFIDKKGFKEKFFNQALVGAQDFVFVMEDYDLSNDIVYK